MGAEVSGPVLKLLFSTLALCQSLLSATGAWGSEQVLLCTSKVECNTATWCRGQIVTSELVIDHGENEIRFGAVGQTDQNLVFSMVPGSEFSLAVGTLTGHEAVAASTITVLKNMEFYLTSVVDIEDQDRRIGVGVLITGACIEGTS